MAEAAHDDSLEPALKNAEAELARHLDEACESHPDDVSHGSVDELLRLEDELLAAARAADEAVRLRRRMEERGSVEGAAVAPAAMASTPAPEAAGRVREFPDRQGREWRVWEVRPGLGRPLSDLHRYLGDYVNGWLAFASLDDDDVRRRLPAFPPDWLQMSDREVQALLYQAVEVPKRRVAGSG